MTAEHMLAEVIIAFLDLVEAEGRLFRRGILSLMRSLLLLVVSAGLTLGGAALCIWAGCIMFSWIMPLAAAVLLSGFIAIFLGGAIAWYIDNRP